jgi:hypothetical protein
MCTFCLFGYWFFFAFAFLVPLSLPELPQYRMIWKKIMPFRTAPTANPATAAVSLTSCRVVKTRAVQTTKYQATPFGEDYDSRQTTPAVTKQDQQ